MRAELSCQLPVKYLAVFAEMAWLERRPELGLVCRSARDHDRRITEVAVQAVLAGLGDAGTRNVIDWCIKLGLCDSGRGLTKLGLEVAETDQAPVPEQGVYAMWCAEHPLLGRRILAADRLNSTRDPRFEAVTDLTFVPDRGVVFCSVADPQQHFVLRDLPTTNKGVTCLPLAGAPACQLVWHLDFDAGRDQWQLHGHLDRGPIAHQPESAGLDLSALANTWGAGPLVAFGRWQAAERYLAVGFAELSDAEKQDFRKSFRLLKVEVPGKGSYLNVDLHEVPIGPASDADAQRWAMARFDRHLHKNPSYRSRGELRRLFVELTQNTRLARHSPMLPAHADLAQHYLQQQRRDLFWSVAAPVDLAPRGCMPEELAALRIGQERIGGEP